ncbi:MAG: tetratricopeptide repeat protein, partial [Polyangiaceae bacterium]|nr:tetratricopeptide repeat protein [Polyangiaceae bacterium]
MARAGCLILLLSALAGCAGAQRSPATPADGDPALGDEAADNIKRGEEALKARDFEGAKKIFAETLASDPQHPKANHYLGVALEGLGDKAGAEKQYRAALAHDPALGESAVNLSAMLVDAERYDDATAVLEPAVQKNPRDPLLRTNLAYARVGKGDVEGAVAAFQAALALEDRPEIRIRFAEVLIGADRIEQGVAEANKAMASAPAQVQILATVADLLRQARKFSDCVAVLDKA